MSWPILNPIYRSEVSGELQKMDTDAEGLPSATPCINSLGRATPSCGMYFNIIRCQTCFASFKAGFRRLLRDLLECLNRGTVLEYRQGPEVGIDVVHQRQA